MVVEYIDNGESDVGKNPARAQKRGQSPFSGLYAATRAGREGYTDIVLMLLVHVKPGADQLNPLFGPALISAVQNNREETVAQLLDQGLDPNWHTPGDHFPRPAILEASRTNQSKNIFNASR